MAGRFLIDGWFDDARNDALCETCVSDKRAGSEHAGCPR